MVILTNSSSNSNKSRDVVTFVNIEHMQELKLGILF